MTDYDYEPAMLMCYLKGRHPMGSGFEGMSRGAHGSEPPPSVTLLPPLLRLLQHVNGQIPNFVVRETRSKSTLSPAIKSARWKRS